VGRWEFITLFRSLAEQGKCLLVSSHELEELEKLTDHIAIMARGRIAAVGSVAQIRDRLDDHPLTVRLDIAQAEDRHNGAAGPEPALPRGVVPSAGGRGRELAAALLQLADVVGVELLDDGPGDEPVSRVLVRARNPQRFFQDLARLVLEEWFEVRHLETLDESTQAVLGYLLGGR
jgi:ABC-2 type transport system ATP-binding protein